MPRRHRRQQAVAATAGGGRQGRRGSGQQAATHVARAQASLQRAEQVHAAAQADLAAVREE
eukprot:11174043-Lingulodinium_polyedra.AAC.1